MTAVVTRLSGRVAARGPLVAVAAFGTGTVAAVVLCMAVGLAAERRRAELTLLRARGGSLRGLAGAVALVAALALPLRAVRRAGRQRTLSPRAPTPARRTATDP